MGFEDLDDLSELDEVPPFEDDFDLPDFDEGAEGGGISRTFKIVGAVLIIAVLGIVILLILFALRGGDGLSANQKTSTAVVQTNVAVEGQYNNTQTAIAMALVASQTAVRDFELASTATQDAFNAQQTQSAIDAANTATAEAYANQTATAEASATQQALSMTQTAEAERNRLSGQVVGQNNQPFGGVTIKLYRDNGDNVFTPGEVATVEVPGITPVPATGAGEPAPISYGQTVEGSLEAGASDMWTFQGATGDVVTITTVAGEPVTMDMYLTLVAPNGTTLVEDDDSGEGLNAEIKDYTLPTSGEYTIRVSSVSGPGPYILTLANASQSGQSRLPYMNVSYTRARVVPRAAGVALDWPDTLAQNGTTPTPTPENIDELIATLTTGPNGEFDFGSLEPGVYWLEADYNSLPPDLKAQIPPTDRVLIRVDVPTTGPVTFTIGGTTIELTAEASNTPMPTGFVTTPTETPEGGVVVVPTEMASAIPQTGLFSDISDKANDMDTTGGLTVLAIAAIGLVAVVFIARKLRTSA